MDLTECLSTALNDADEHGDAIWIAEADVEGAFKRLRAAAVAQGWLASGVKCDLTASILREILGLKLHIRISSFEAPDLITQHFN